MVLLYFFEESLSIPKFAELFGKLALRVRIHCVCAKLLEFRANALLGSVELEDIPGEVHHGITLYFLVELVKLIRLAEINPIFVDRYELPTFFD